jgi:hypothetical protein
MAERYSGYLAKGSGGGGRQRVRALPRKYSQSTPRSTRVGEGGEQTAAQRALPDCIRSTRKVLTDYPTRYPSTLRGADGQRGPADSSAHGTIPARPIAAAHIHAQLAVSKEAPPSTTSVALVCVRSTGAGSHGSARTATSEGAKRALRMRTALSRYSGQRIIEYKDGAAGVGGSIRPHTPCVCLYARA